MTPAFAMPLPPDPVFAWVPFDVVEKAGSESKGLGEIVGIGSTEHRDDDGEIVRQSGIKWARFLKGGFLTMEHPAGVISTVGEPLSDPELIQLADGTPATRIRAGLYLHDPVGKAIYEKARNIKKSGGTRKFGFSIEGNADERSPQDRRDILQCSVWSLAVTSCPRNASARWDPLMASLAVSAGAIGVTTQGAASMAPPAAELSTFVPQALAGAKRDQLDRLFKDASAEDLAAFRTLLKQPHLTLTAARQRLSQHLARSIR